MRLKTRPFATLTVVNPRLKYPRVRWIEVHRGWIQLEEQPK